VQTSPLAAPRKAVVDAQQQVSDIKAKIAVIRSGIESTFQSKDDWIAAKKALADAKAKYDAALKPVMDALQANPEYVKLLEHRKAASAKMEALKDAPKAQSSAEQQQQDDEMSTAAGDVINDGLALRKMEAEARDGDPALSAAKDALDEAKKAFDGLEAQVTTAMQSDPTYIQDQTELTAAQANLLSARTALAAAEKQSHPSSNRPPPTRQPGTRPPGL
jgi:hypothetical protein